MGECRTLCCVAADAGALGEGSESMGAVASARPTLKEPRSLLSSTKRWVGAPELEEARGGLWSSPWRPAPRCVNARK